MVFDPKTGNITTSVPGKLENNIALREKILTLRPNIASFSPLSVANNKQFDSYTKLQILVNCFETLIFFNAIFTNSTHSWKASLIATPSIKVAEQILSELPVGKIQIIISASKILINKIKSKNPINQQDEKIYVFLYKIKLNKYLMNQINHFLIYA